MLRHMSRPLYKTLRSALTSRYPFLTLTHYRERKILATGGDGQANAIFRSPDCRKFHDRMAHGRADIWQIRRERAMAVEERRPGDGLPYVTVCVVTYNSASWMDAFVKCVATLDYPKEKIGLSIVDNGSTDTTLNVLRAALSRHDLADNVISLVQQDNTGFGGGQNVAVENAVGPYVLIINPDAMLTRNSVRVAVDFAMQDQSDVCAWEFAQTPFEHPKYYDPVTWETAWNSHACVLVDREKFREISGYDTALFMYGEDVEISYRFRQNGYRLRYIPTARVEHNVKNLTAARRDQDVRCMVANLCLRRRYGRLWDRVIGRVMTALSLRHSASAQQDTLKRALDIYQDIKWNFAPVKNRITDFPFNGFDYELRRIGVNTPLPEPSGKTRGADLPKVSVITRVHKTTDILFDALECVRRQTYPNIEHIVVFNGCEPVFYPDIISVKFSDFGRSEAANRGVKAASGDYILFLDYDDLLFADHIEGLVGAVMSTPDAVAAYACSWEAPTSDRRSGRMKSLVVQNRMETQFSPEALAETNFFAIQSMLVKKTAFWDIGGLDTRLEFCEDWDLWKRLLVKGPFVPYRKTTSIFFTPASLRDRVSRAWDMATGNA